MIFQILSRHCIIENIHLSLSLVHCIFCTTNSLIVEVHIDGAVCLPHSILHPCCFLSGFPVTIRLLDPPLHEFLPEGNLEDIVSKLASETGAKEEEVSSRVEKLSEVNPMLGFRGCRLNSLLSLANGIVGLLII